MSPNEDWIKFVNEVSRFIRESIPYSQAIFNFPEIPDDMHIVDNNQSNSLKIKIEEYPPKSCSHRQKEEAEEIITQARRSDRIDLE